MTFEFLDIIRLVRDFPTPGGTIPAGCEGTVLEVCGGEAYLVEFDGAWKVPEFVPADALEAAPGTEPDVDWVGGPGMTPVTPEQIIQASIDPPAASLLVTDATTDEEMNAYIRGKRRGCH